MLACFEANQHKDRANQKYFVEVQLVKRHDGHAMIACYF